MYPPIATLLEVLRPYVELLYFVAGIALLFVVAYSLQQLRLLKEDIRTRNVRAEREKAIEAANCYIREFISEYNQMWRQLQKSGLGTYTGPVRSDFKFDLLPFTVQKRATERFEKMLGYQTFNILEMVAAPFTTGIADEKVGFRIIGRTYCATVADNYDILSLCYSDGTAPYFQNIVQLYRTWGLVSAKKNSKLRDQYYKKRFPVSEKPSSSAFSPIYNQASANKRPLSSFSTRHLPITGSAHLNPHTRFCLTTIANEIVARRFSSTRIPLTARQPITMRPASADAAFSDLPSFHPHSFLSVHTSPSSHPARALRALGGSPEMSRVPDMAQRSQTCSLA